MANKPNAAGGRQPSRAGQSRKMATPIPLTGQRKQPKPAPRVKSSGALAPVQAAPPPQTAETPPPPTPGPVNRQPIKPKPQGLAIKTKIVLAMSALACGVSLLIFLIVMLITTSTLEETIQESGTGMLQQAEAIHRPYVQGLNDTSLIAYFNEESNRSKFEAYRTGMQRNFFHARIEPCNNFATWEQLWDDRLWVLVAGHAMDNRNAVGLTDEQLVEILGQDWAAIRNLQGEEVAPAPPTPRRVNIEALQTHRARFTPLFTQFNLQPSDTAMQLSAAVRQSTVNLINLASDGRGRAGLRYTIFQHYKRDFTNDLNSLTNAEDSQVRYIIIDLPRSLKPWATNIDLHIISPSAQRDSRGGDVALPNVQEGQILVDTEAMVGGIPAYGFTKGLGDGQRISIFLDREHIQNRKQALIFSILGISAVCIGLSILMAFLIGGSITKPLETLMHDIQIISGGNFDHKPRARSNDEIGIVSRLLGDMAVGLKSAQDVWLENQGRKHDLDVAKEIQENLLPKHVPRIAGYDVSAYYSPSKEVGGDYYDFFLVDKTHLGMVCADVSGKGIPGSMVMMMAKALVSYEAQENLSPRDIFCKVNRTLAKDIKRGMFVTAFYMLLDIPTARLTVASAGHNPLLLYRAATKQCIEVNPGGIALGFDKDGRLFERNMKEEVIQLQRGDRAVIFTDGVTEAMSPSGEEFGEERMQAITIQAAGRSSAEYLTALVNAIQGHAQSDDQHDDITIVTLKVG